MGVTARIMKLALLALSAVLAAALAQDTYHCPDGWDLHEHRDTCDCFLMSGSEPNNYDHSGEMCLSMMEIHDPFFPIFRDYYWNDLGCDSAAHYICQNSCLQY